MSRDFYFSQRPKAPDDNGPEEWMRFWIALRAKLERYTNADYFAERFGYSYSGSGCDPANVSQMTKEKLGIDYTDFTDRNLPIRDEILDIIEVFYDCVSKPIAYEGEDTGHPYPIKFDKDIGQFEFENDINDIFQRFYIPYRLQDGIIRLHDSAVLDSYVWDFELPTEDSHLLGLITKAREAFFDWKEDRKHEGLCLLVDAYDRIKTTIDPNDKKNSVGQIIGKITSDPAIAEKINELMQNLTNVSNDCTIRHHEHGKLEIKEPQLIEFLFYSYYNTIRLMLNALDK